MTLDASVTCVDLLCSDGANLEGDGITNRVEMNSLPPLGVNLHALLYLILGG